MALEPGTPFGPYRIESLIGRGGMGTVYAATDSRLGRRVALKVLSLESDAEPAFRDRFVRESRVAASLDHPNILPIYEAGEQDGHAFIAMRLVDGSDLDQVLRSDGPMAPERAIRIIVQVAAALDAAHAAGLVHRDVKPGNILLARVGGSDHAYLSDFGLTKQVADSHGSTRTGQLMGTVDYVAPEQINGDPVDARADVYSLGCVLFELLTGAPPYRRDSEMAILFAHVNAPLPALRDLNPGLPEALEPVMARALAKDPDDRFASAGEFARAASAALTGAEPISEPLAQGHLFADLRGYTAFVESRGDAEAVQLLDRYRRMVRAVVARTAGSEIKTEGDSFYVVFPSASRAVAAGLAITAEAARLTGAEPEYPITVGVGVHAGETSQTAEGPVGSAVNVAARICAQAAAGEVLASDTVRGLTRTTGAFTFEPLGTRRLKGIAEPMPLYRAIAAQAGSPRQTPTTPVERLLGRRGRRRRFALVGIGLVAVGAAVAIGLSLGGGTASGSRIVFARQVSSPGASGCDSPLDSKLYVVDPARPELTPYRLTSGTDLYESDPATSTNGEVVVFAGGAPRRESGVFAVNPEDRSASSIQVLGGSFFTVPTSVAVSGDGTAVAWITGDGIIQVVQAAGTGMIDIPDPTNEPPAQVAQAVAFLPNGRLLAVVGPPDSLTPRQTLLTMAADGSDPVPLDVDLGEDVYTDIAVSPDGTRAVLGKFVGEVRSWEVLTLANTAIEELILPEGAEHPAWSPDGERIVVQAGTPDIQLVEVNVASGETRQLTSLEGASACSPTWASGDLAAIYPEPSPAPSGVATEFEVGVLEAGRYLLNTFQPNMELTVDDGWWVRRNWVDGWSIARTDFEASELDGGRIQVGLTGPCGDEGQVALGSAPTDVIDWLHQRSDLSVSEPRAINLGGYTGLEVEVQGIAGASCAQEPDFPYWQLFFLGDDAAGLADGEVVRISVVDVEGLSVAFMIFSSEADLGPFGDQAALVMETFTFPGS